MLEVLRAISAKVPSEQQEAKFSDHSPLSTSLDSPGHTVIATNAEAEFSTATPVPGGFETGVDTESSTGSETSNRRMEGSENEAETEEDEGMVLVGRPA